MPEEGIRIDWHRGVRTGLGEAVFCDGKSAAQIADIVRQAEGRAHALLLTRLAAEQFARLDAAIAGRLDYDALSRTAILDHDVPEPLPAGIGIVTAGTADMPVAAEARRTLAFNGAAAPLIGDVGVAGLWRLLERRDEIAQWRVVIAVAGMEGALFSVLGGAVPGLVIAVPTSVGYGVAAGGTLALHSALAACAPGVVSVNIDNGFGAACAALKIVQGLPPNAIDGS